MRQIHPMLLGGVLLAGAGVAIQGFPARAQGKAAAGKAAAAAPAPAKSKEIYVGEGDQGEGMKMGGWGSGLATADRAYKTIGQNSIRVETNGFYSGARLQFETAKDITDQKNDPDGFLEFIIRFQPGTKKSTSGPGGGGYPGASGGGSSFGGSSAGPSPGGAGYPGGLGGPGGFDGSGGEQTLQPDTHKMKFVMVCDEGTFVASNFPVALFPASEEGWYSVAVPFVAFKGLDKAATCKMKELRVFGDSKDTFWIGQIRTTTDDEPIAVDPLDDLEVSAGEPVEFRAQATGGISPLQYVWDFDQSDGPTQEDATGQVVVHVFRKASPQVPGQNGELQPYVVTLTVKDLSGAKKPKRVTANVIVNP